METVFFPCPKCGKKIKWKPAIAGKTGRCNCGATIRAPETLDPPDENGLLYGLAPTEGSIDPTPTPVAAPAAIPVDAVIDYPATRRGRQPTDDAAAHESTDLRHDFYLPAGVMALGIVSILAWVAFKGQFTPRMYLAVVIVAGAEMVIKTVALSLLAWHLAKKSGGNLGSPMTIVLKIAALTLVLDGTQLWVHAAMTAMGVYSTKGGITLSVTFAELFVRIFWDLVSSALVGWLVARFAYGMYSVESWFFAAIMAGGNWLANVLMLLVLWAVIQAAAVAAPKSAAAPALPGITGAPAPAPAPATPFSDEDARISNRIRREHGSILERTRSKSGTPSSNKITALIDKLYDAGAQKVYMDLLRDQVYVLLPGSDAQRDACLDVAHAYQTQNGLIVTPPDDTMLGTYLVIDLRRPKS